LREIRIDLIGRFHPARPREGGNPAVGTSPWIPACAGMSGVTLV
jgi:hypothetical protein